MPHRDQKSDRYEKRSNQVQAMFDKIAARYDLANTLLSFGLHHYWKRRLVSQVSPTDRILDLCTGTGDLLPLLKKRSQDLIGADFSYEMLAVAKKRFPTIELLQCDALNSPFEDQRFDAVTVAFGVRNFEDLDRGLQEIRRILKVGGMLYVLEFGQPEGALWGSLYKFYSNYILPTVGGTVSGDREAYKYLLKTSAVFPCGRSFSDILDGNGFASKTTIPLQGGIAFIYSATRTDI